MWDAVASGSVGGYAAIALRPRTHGRATPVTRTVRCVNCSGYCFDGETSRFNPFPVLSALDAGCITETELRAASSTNWLGLTPAALLEDACFLTDTRKPSPRDGVVDISGWEARRVHAAPLLLQIGMLSLVPGRPGACRPPSKYARRSWEIMLATALTVTGCELELALPALATALEARDRDAFEAAATRVLELVPNVTAKAGVPREAPFHAALLGAILASVASTDTAAPEMQFQRRRADVVVTFPKEPAATWFFEVGLGSSRAELCDKLGQAKANALDFPATATVTCCAILIGEPKPASAAAGRAGSVFGFAWSEREGAGAGAHWKDFPEF